MKKLVVLGAGESGVGAALLGVAKDWNVLVSEYGTIKEETKKVLSNKGIKWEEGGHSDAVLSSADLVIKSPGIALETPIMKKVLEQGIQWEDEIEFTYRYASGKIIAITGSNGKTTTTMLAHHIFKKAGCKVGLGGNIGESWAKQVAEGGQDYWVLELSSFQLDGIRTFKPDIAIVTNISPDHLDRYEYSVEKYAAAKKRITMNQGEQDVLIYNADDKASIELFETDDIKAQLLPFSLKKKLEQGAYLENENIEIIINPTNILKMTIHDLALQGKHNVANSMAASIAARVLEIRKDSVRESLSDFNGAPHRLEFVATIHGIDFVNDSKATNINSTWWALESANKPVVWIVGGVDKGNDYTELDELVAEKVKAIVCLGKDNSKLLKHFEGKIENIVEVGTMKDAVEQSYRFGSKEDVVLLSPCCASFDLFENYEDRGNQFKRNVRGL